MLDQNSATLDPSLVERNLPTAAPAAANPSQRELMRVRRIKRVIDIVFMVLAAPVAILVLGLCAMAVSFESRGPIFFRQKRFGVDGRQFVVTKFRTMYVDKLDFSGGKQTTKDDDRVTRVGRFLRRTCLDELPQLWDIILGNMTLVGPRPHPIGMRIDGVLMEDLYPDYEQRLRLPPGLTGLSQINGNRGPVHDYDYGRERLDYDKEYIENWSVWQDLRILLLTPILPFRKGCY